MGQAVLGPGALPPSGGPVEETRRHSGQRSPGQLLKVPRKNRLGREPYRAGKQGQNTRAFHTDAIPGLTSTHHCSLKLLFPPPSGVLPLRGLAASEHCVPASEDTENSTSCAPNSALGASFHSQNTRCVQYHAHFSNEQNPPGDEEFCSR